MDVTAYFRAKLRQRKEDVRVRGKMQKLCGKAAPLAFVILRRKLQNDVATVRFI